MTADQARRYRALEGCRVNVSLADSSRIDDCQLISTVRPGVSTIWVFSNGADLFLPSAEIVDLWERSA
jgi:hypothetical protein